MTDPLHPITQKAHIDASTYVDPLKELQDPPAYRLAFADSDFLLREETRGIRVQLELLKPSIILDEHGIQATFVVFGSARLRSQEDAEQEHQEAQEKLLANPNCPIFEKNLRKAEFLVKNAHYYEDARKLGQLIGKYERSAAPAQKVFICTGGGPGIMEAANRGASEAGSPNIGLNIVLPHEQKPNPYITPELCFRFHYFATRKTHLLMRSRALITFPGGFGTLDELFEVLTLIQTKKTNALPIILYGREYWNRLISFETLVEEGMISEEDLQLFKYADTPNEVWQILQQWYHLPDHDLVV